MVAATIKDIGQALARLDPGTRALLDLAVRKRRDDSAIAEVLHVEADEVGRRRQEALDKLAADLGIDDREQREELVATLPDLPQEVWR